MNTLLNLIPHLAVFNYENTKYFTPEEVENISRTITVASILFIVFAILLVTFVFLFLFLRKSSKTPKIKKNDSINILNYRNGGSK